MDNDAKPRILIVDDEQDIRDMLSRHFRFLGYDVFGTASNGIEALQILKKERVEVVISDLIMPKMNGVDLLKEIKTQYPMVHVIIITGYVTLNNLLTAMRRGADTCIFKPLDDLTELEEAVDHAVNQLKMWQNKLKTLMNMKR
ncbi:MAG: response regulator [Desulfobacterales bacterium]|nr:response regulator [Desulfobacterales bacterium]